MNAKYLLTLFVLLSLGATSWGSEAGEPPPQDPRIIHFPVTSLKQNEMLVVEARIDGLVGRPVFMRVYYRSGSEQSFQYVEMTQSSSGFFGEIPPSEFSQPQVEYFILALLHDQKVITYPELNPYGNPLRVEIAGGFVPQQPKTPPPTQTPTPEVETTPQAETEPSQSFGQPTASDSPLLVLSPNDGEVFTVGEEIVIAVSVEYQQRQDSVDVNSLNLIIDGFNVSLDVELSEYLLSYTHLATRPGTHQIQLQGYYQSGLELPTTTWSFEVVGDADVSIERREPIATGKVFAETRHENISDENFSDNNIGGFVSGKYGVAEYDAKVYLTTREDDQFQPRNRYSFKLDVPIFGVTLGDTYPRFNDLMLWGKRVRGVHGRAHFGFINFDLVYGQTLRRVSNVIVDTSGVAIPNQSNNDSTLVTPQQNLLAARTSFGSGRNFQLGFNLVKVRDDTNSVRNADGFQTPPQDNLVVGSDLLLAVDNHRIEFRAAAAFSLFSNDIAGGPLSKSEIEDQFDVDLPFDPADFSDFLIINSSTTPLDPRDLTSFALTAGFRFNYFNHNIQAGYKSIGSQYMSLGNAFLRTNLRGFYVNDRFRLFQNRLYLNLGFEHYLDNFDADSDNPSTTLQTINTGVSFFPGQGFPSLTFNLRNHHRDNDVDSLFIANDPTVTGENTNTRDLSVQLNHNTKLFDLNHAISVGYIASDRDDGFNAQRLNNNLPSTETSSNVQTVSVRTQYKAPLVTTFNFARNDNNFSQGVNTFNFKMFGGTAQYFFLNRKLETHFGINYTTASGAAFDSTNGSITAITDYKRTLFNLGTRFEFTPGHFFLLDGSIIFFNDNGSTFDTTTSTFIPNPSFTDRIFRLYYEKRF